MLSSWDDYPIHQTAHPVAHPATSDPGAYGRYWFMGFDRDLTTHVGFGLSVHPNRRIIDAALSIARDGEQRSVFASGPLSLDRDLQVGPFRLEVIEPMRTLRIVADEHDGLGVDLTFSATTQCIEDSHMIRKYGPTLVAERTRTVQFGRFAGTIEHAGETIVCDPTSWIGLRDRSWGARTTGTVAETTMAAKASSIYFAWTLLDFGSDCLLAAVNETPDGRREAAAAARLPKLADGDPAYGQDDKIVRGDRFAFDIDYRPRTRRASSVGLQLGPYGALDDQIDIEIAATFQMKGLGYFHPDWRHGTDHGGVVVGSDHWRLADIDPLDESAVHTQHLVRARRRDGRIGLGLFEHVALGVHRPTGLGPGTTPVSPR